jgi:hypothetical protein
LFVTVIQAYGLEPSGEGALATIAFELAFAGVGTRREQQHVNLVDELLAAVAICVIMVVNGLEQRITLAVEIATGDPLIASDERFGHP